MLLSKQLSSIGKMDMKIYSQLGRTQVGNSKEPTFNFFQPESQSHEKLNNPGCWWHVPFPQYTILHMLIRSSTISSAKIHHHDINMRNYVRKFKICCQYTITNMSYFCVFFKRLKIVKFIKEIEISTPL
jgi:hypothetical protein